MVASVYPSQVRTVAQGRSLRVSEVDKKIWMVLVQLHCFLYF